jgi:hypothetical protein
MILMVAGLAGSVSAAEPPPQTTDNCRYFETGFYVCNEFLVYFETYGDLEIFGYPITRAFDDPTHNLKVQYFQRARMEYHPENSAPYIVLLGLLIDELGYPNSPPVPASQVPAGPLHLYFPETGHVVSYAFLDYYRSHGGLDIFGYPRSEFMLENDRIVQYFQRARMEWHPENTSGPQIQLSNLGEVYVERFRATIPAAAFETQPPSIIGGIDTPTQTPVAPVVTSLHPSASVRYVITGRAGGQTVFVYVTDQQNRPVQGAQVKMIVHYPSGDQHYTFKDPTNDSGFAGFYFDILPASPGQKVVISVTVTYGNLTGTTQTFFLPWW